MKNWLYIIYIGLMSCFVSSCQQSLDEAMQESTSGKAQISFTIALDDIDSRASRAEWEDNENSSDAEMGAEFENQIDLTSNNGLRVLVYNLDGIYLGEVTNKEIRKVSTNEYMFDGQFVVNNLSSEQLACRLEVFANCGTNLDTFNQNTNFIPMWGVKEIILNLVKGELTMLKEPIYLLRSMAKVEVKLDSLIADEYNLTSVKIDKYNSVGNVKPNGASTATATEKMNSDAVFNPNVTASGTDLFFTKVSDDEFYVYLPEHQNVGDGVSPAAISVVINENPYTIEFKNYTSGQPNGSAYNIVRNHYYQYTITSVAEQSVEVDLSLKYQVMDWTNVENPGLSFE